MALKRVLGVAVSAAVVFGVVTAAPSVTVVTMDAQRVQLVEDDSKVATSNEEVTETIASMSAATTASEAVVTTTTTATAMSTALATTNLLATVDFAKAVTAKPAKAPFWCRNSKHFKRSWLTVSTKRYAGPYPYKVKLCVWVKRTSTKVVNISGVTIYGLNKKAKTTVLRNVEIQFLKPNGTGWVYFMPNDRVGQPIPTKFKPLACAPCTLNIVWAVSARRNGRPSSDAWVPVVVGPNLKGGIYT
jgi:hypothetical protein